MSLRQKIESHFRNRSGQGSLVGVIVATVMLSMIVAAGTEWYLSMRKNIGNTEEKLEAQTIAMSEWERLSHMSLDELEASRDALKKPYAAGQFTVSVNLGQKGTFNNGTCGAVTGGYANCFKDTTITVSRDGSRLFTTRTLPLMAGDYTRREIDAKLAALDSKITNNTNAINSINGRLNGNEFIKNKTPNYDLNLRYEKKAGDDTFKLHAYNGNTEIPLASQSSAKPDLPDNLDYTILPDGTIIQWGYVDLGRVESGNITINFPIPFKQRVTSITTQRHCAEDGGYKGGSILISTTSLTGFIFHYDGWTSKPNAVHFVAIGK